MVGDFNMPKADWETMQSTDELEQNCIDKFNDHFMYQHVNIPTRFRLNQNANILDLVLTNEQNMIPDGVNAEAPLGASDHVLLSFDFQCYTWSNTKPHATLKYHKADYAAMKVELDVYLGDLIQG